MSSKTKNIGRLAVYTVVYTTVVAVGAAIVWESHIRDYYTKFVEGDTIEIMRPQTAAEPSEYDRWLTSSSTQKMLEIEYEQYEIEKAQNDLDSKQQELEQRKEKLREQELSLL